MKLNLHLYKTNNRPLKKKFRNKKVLVNVGRYVTLHYIAHNQKRRVGSRNLRVSKQTVILLKKKRKGNSLSFVVVSLYKHEKVKWRYLISSSYMVYIKVLRKALSYKIK